MAQMEDEIRAHLSAHGGVTTTGRLRAMGVTATQVKRMLASGVIVRLRRSTFVDGRRWAAASPWERHELRARAVATDLCGPGRPYALSHHSALALHGVGMYGVDDRVHLVRTDGQRGRSGRIVHVHPPLLPRWVDEVEGIPAVRPDLACLQVGAAFGIVPGLVSADSALRTGATDLAGLQAARASVVGPRSPRADVVLEHATGLSDSGGETRCRWLMHTLGLPTPALQVPVHDLTGQLVGVVDFLFADQWTIVEFDGALKYGERADVVAEKHREDRLRELGYEVVRIVWAELAHPERVQAKIRAAFHRALTRHRAPA